VAVAVLFGTAAVVLNSLQVSPHLHALKELKGETLF
jgi:hypothetical protein